ncbi:MAG: DUF1385 domain-containing protein [Chloroflexi bacterium]|nr:DUF1385 domain-containing protein [Chloroflexota bacterium]
MAQPFTYGGQAVIEGVMMRGERFMAVAVRRPDGVIVAKVEPLGTLAESRWRRVPLVRGVVVLAEALVLGIRTLQYSAAVAMGRDDERLSRGETALILGTSLAVAVGVFFLGPAAAVHWADPEGGAPLIANTVEGLLRLGLFLGYLALIARLPEIRRVFQYHGAEHMTIHAYEHQAPLTEEGVRPFPPEHPRCGTSFLITVMLLATLVFSLVGQEPLWWRLLSRVVLIPVIAGAAYEVIRLAARREDGLLGRALAAPGIWLQKITTRQPEADQIEVALAAFKAVRSADQSAPERAAGEPA